MTYLPILLLIVTASAPDELAPASSNSELQVVYRQVLDTLGNPFVQEESELPSWTISESQRYRRALGVPTKLFSAFLRENAASRKLGAGHELHPGALTISRATYLADPCKGWDAFMGDYPSINGFAVLSLIAVEPDSSRAVVYVARRPHCQSKELKGYLYLLEHVAAGWRIVDKVNTSSRARSAG